MTTPTVLAYGDRALLVELGDTERVVAWVDALQRQEVPGVADLVPAAETVLVVADEGVDVRALRAALAAVVPEDAGSVASGGEVVEIPVVYDGPDLADVARLTGLSESEVVAAHTGARPGGSPSAGSPRGSATWSAVDPRLHVPAARQRPHGGARGCGRPGRRLQRGLPARVARRLAADRYDGRADVGPRPRPARAAASGGRRPVRAGGRLMTARLRVLRPGPLCLVEDLGRRGVSGIGVGRSGAADRAALRLANRALANPEDAAALEVTLGGLELEVVVGPVWLCVTGAPARSASTAATSAPSPSSRRPRGPSYAWGCRRPGCGPTSRCAAASTCRRCSGRAATT